MENATVLYHNWLHSHHTQQLTEELKSQLSELYWDYVEVSRNKTLSHAIRVNRLRNRWVLDENLEYKFYPDERLVKDFVINGVRVFAPRSVDWDSGFITSDQ